jgi:hypothetical protein
MSRYLGQQPEDTNDVYLAAIKISIKYKHGNVDGDINLSPVA